MEVASQFTALARLDFPFIVYARKLCKLAAATALDNATINFLFWHGANYHCPVVLPDTTGLSWREGILRYPALSRNQPAADTSLPANQPTKKDDEEKAVSTPELAPAPDLAPVSAPAPKFAPISALAPDPSRYMALAPEQCQVRAAVPEFNPERAPVPESSPRRTTVPLFSPEVSRASSSVRSSRALSCSRVTPREGPSSHNWPMEGLGARHFLERAPPSKPSVLEPYSKRPPECPPPSSLDDVWPGMSLPVGGSKCQPCVPVSCFFSPHILSMSQFIPCLCRNMFFPVPVPIKFVYPLPRVFLSSVGK